MHWTFEDRSGSQIFDISGHGHHGTLEDGSFVSSPWGDAVSLDGVDDYISFTGPRDPDDFGGEEGEFTIHARVKVSDVNKYNVLCSGCAPLSHTSIGSSNVDERVVTAMYDNDTGNKAFSKSTDSLVDDTWTDVTIVVDGGVGTDYYLDCDFDRSDPDTSIRLHDYNYSSVGQAGVASNWFGGQIDDLRVWNRALSATEIEDLCEVESPCNGDSLATTLGITLPSPPVGSYTLPGSYVTVTTTAQLVAKAGDPVNYPVIVLSDTGSFTTTGLPVNNHVNIKGQELWAETPGGVTLPYGIQAGGNGSAYENSEIHGIVFDIDDDTYAATNPNPNSPPRPSAIMNWGDATDMVIEDVVIHGNGVLERGVTMRATEALKIGRVVIDGIKRFGIWADSNDCDPASILDTGMLIHDVRLSDIADPNDDTTGCGISIGQRARISNIHVRDARWCGIVTKCFTENTLLSDLDIDRIGIGESTGGVGVYIERRTEDLTVQDFCVGPDTRIGVNSEWDNCGNQEGIPEGPRGLNTVVQGGLIESSEAGVHFDQGTVDGHVEDVVFRNYAKSGIIFHHNRSVEDEDVCPNYDDGSTQTNNTFEETEAVCCDATCDLSLALFSSTPSCEGCTPGGGC